MQTTWKVIGASVQGVAHKKLGIPCQDAHEFKVLPGGTLLVVAADGAGSADRSTEGANCAVEQAIRTLETHLLTEYELDEATCKTILFNAFSEARQAIIALAAAEKSAPSTFACTLTAAFVNRQWLAAAQIGDGFVVAKDIQDQFILVLRPQHGEYANETYFITQDNAMETIDIRVHPAPVRSLAVMTDGLMRLSLYMRQYRPSPRFFSPLVNYVSNISDHHSGTAGLINFLDSKRVCSRTHDDKTLVMAVCL